MSILYKISSKIIFNKKNQKPGWYSVKYDNDISDYYLWLYSRGGKRWNSCLNGPHTTFIAGDRESRIVSEQEIEPFLNQDIDIFYENIVYTNGRAFWLTAYSDKLNKIREILNLLPRPHFHITLGNIKNIHHAVKLR